MKKVLDFIFQPLKLVSHRHISEKLALFFSKHDIAVYIVSALVTALILYLVYTSS